MCSACMQAMAIVTWHWLACFVAVLVILELFSALLKHVYTVV